MRIIKTFENFNQKTDFTGVISKELVQNLSKTDADLDFKESGLNESYEEIEKEEYLSPKYRLTFLDERDIKTIEERLPNFTIEIEEQGESNAIIAKNTEETYRIFIEKDEDWNYYVSIFESVIGRNGTISFEKNYYKCDQIEELKELLNDKISLW
jgi:hypothetical protein